MEDQEEHLPCSIVHGASEPRTSRDASGAPFRMMAKRAEIVPMEGADPQLYRGGSRGRKAAGRWTLGDHRASPASQEAEVSPPGAQTHRRPSLPGGDLVRAAHKDPVGVPAAGDGLWQRGDMLAKTAQVAEGRGWEKLPRVLLELLNRAGEIDWERAAVDYSHVRAFDAGGKKRSKSRGSQPFRRLAPLAHRR